MYFIVLSRSAQKDLEAVAEPYQSAIERKIDKLANTPFPNGVQKLKGYEGSYRVRVGDYRVIYEVDEATKTVDISAVGHRREIYK